MTPNVWKSRHAVVKSIKVRTIKFVAVIYIDTCSISQTLGLSEVTSKAIIRGELQGSDVLSPVGKGACNDAVVDVATVAPEVPVRPHVRLEEVSRCSILGFVPPWKGAGVVALFFQDGFVDM